MQQMFTPFLSPLKLIKESTKVEKDVAFCQITGIVHCQKTECRRVCTGRNWLQELYRELTSLKAVFPLWSWNPWWHEFQSPCNCWATLSTMTSAIITKKATVGKNLRWLLHLWFVCLGTWGWMLWSRGEDVSAWLMHRYHITGIANQCWVNLVSQPGVFWGPI